MNDLMGWDYDAKRTYQHALRDNTGAVWGKVRRSYDSLNNVFYLAEGSMCPPTEFYTLKSARRFVEAQRKNIVAFLSQEVK